MKSFAFAAVAGVATALNSAEFEYMQYVAKFNKVSNDVEEFQTRMMNFANTEKFI